MARVTVEDCVLKVPNRFELVLLAAQRARELSSGVPLTLDRDDDKNPVVALREIADETIGLDQLKGAVVRGLQKHVELDEPEEVQEIEPDAALFGIGLADGAEPGEGEPETGEESEESEESEEGEEDENLAADALDEELEEDMLAVPDPEEADFPEEAEDGGEEP